MAASAVCTGTNVAINSDFFSIKEAVTACAMVRYPMERLQSFYVDKQDGKNHMPYRPAPLVCLRTDEIPFSYHLFLRREEDLFAYLS